jgi:hypothetical protein
MTKLTSRPVDEKLRPSTLGQRRRRAGRPPGGSAAPSPSAVAATPERRWAFLIGVAPLLSPWERRFVEDLGHPKRWSGDRLRLTFRQQAALAKIYAETRARLAAGGHDV